MKWEYYRLAIVETCLEDALNGLGQEGWELVSIMTEARLFQGFQCLLKRPSVVAPEVPSDGRKSIHNRLDKFTPIR